MRKNEFEPTPEQIRASCQLLQEKWDERDIEKRRIVKSKHWTPPIITVPDECKDFELPVDYN